MGQIHCLSYTLPDPWDNAVADWITWLTAAGASPATRKTRRSHVRTVARELALTDPTQVTSGQLVAYLGRPQWSVEHRRGLRASLASFFQWALQAGLIQTDPTERLPMVRAALGAPQPATDEIWRTLLETADPRTTLMARLAGEAGLRRAEVACVHSDDLITDRDGYSLIVHGKGSKQRVIPVTITLAAAITAAHPFGGYLFPGKINGHISPDRVGHLVSHVMPAGWSMHKLRHRFATRGYAGTGNLRAVQEALGHASVATTQRYTAVSSAEVRSVSEAASQAS